MYSDTNYNFFLKKCISLKINAIKPKDKFTLYNGEKNCEESKIVIVFDRKNNRFFHSC